MSRVESKTEGQVSRLWALAEICYILDDLPNAKDRLAVIDALSAMGSLSKPVFRTPEDRSDADVVAEILTAGTTEKERR